jgi:hypothetical protein
MGVQVEHAATLEDNEYKPLAQGVHFVAPLLVCAPHSTLFPLHSPLLRVQFPETPPEQYNEAQALFLSPTWSKKEKKKRKIKEEKKTQVEFNTTRSSQKNIKVAKQILFSHIEPSGQEHAPPQPPPPLVLNTLGAKVGLMRMVPLLIMEPAPQVEHEETFEDIEYKPAAHGVHVVAPPLVPVFVMEPALQVEHEATSDENEYKPGVQRSHVVAPALIPVFVMEPALQFEHEVTFDENEYKPGVQRSHVVLAALIEDPALQSDLQLD